MSPVGALFEEEGAALISEGSTAALMAEYDLSGGVTVEHPTKVFGRLHSAGQAFNAILNWDHLDAGKPNPAQRPATDTRAGSRQVGQSPEAPGPQFRFR